MKSIFITGCDTDIGKTFISIGLVLALNDRGYKTGYYKPFQSGAYYKDGLLSAPDIQELKKHSDIETKFSYLFEGEISPHLGCLLHNVEIDLNKIKKDYEDFSKNKDFIIIEGAGGLYCPACKGMLFSDIIKMLNQEILIVTTPALGRLNHLLMTVECAKLNNIPIKGIIINNYPKNPSLSEKNFELELSQFSDIKILAKIPHFEKFNKDEIIKNFKNIEV